jgi:UPF0176 protein
MLLTNRINKEILKENLSKETFKRRTLSFYRYVHIQEPQVFRNTLYQEWSTISCFGRIYIAHEGINAQMSIPEHHLDTFIQLLEKHIELMDMTLKYAIDDNGKSFYKLTIKVRPKIVADGLEDGTYNLTKVGKHLPPMDFHKAIDDPDAIVIDMRNHYESEIGKFKNAFCPEADTFRDAIKIVEKKLKKDKNKKVLLYCTGGIRCEKASAYLIQQGFSNVYQLEGGIIAYAQHLKQSSESSKFIGKNFVFDERLGESVDGNVISRCHQCGKPCDTHTNCANSDCHLLFIQCHECNEKYNGCCSIECNNITMLSPDEKEKFRVLKHAKYAGSKIFNNSLKLSLMQHQLDNDSI